MKAIAPYDPPPLLPSERAGGLTKAEAWVPPADVVLTMLLRRFRRYPAITPQLAEGLRGEIVRVMADWDATTRRARNATVLVQRQSVTDDKAPPRRHPVPRAAQRLVPVLLQALAPFDTDTTGASMLPGEASAILMWSSWARAQPPEMAGLQDIVLSLKIILFLKIVYANRESPLAWFTYDIVGAIAARMRRIAAAQVEENRHKEKHLRVKPITPVKPFISKQAASIALDKARLRSPAAGALWKMPTHGVLAERRGRHNERSAKLRKAQEAK